MESAVYGRMSLGRCIQIDAHVGCKNDVLYITDKLCSGRNTCELNVPSGDLLSANKECLSYLQLYLHVDYSCVKVFQPGQTHCSGQPITVDDTEGFLSSHVTDQTGCGSTNSPWRINALSGQNIEINIIDFGSEHINQNNDSAPEILYGHIIDGDKLIRINGGRERQQYIYTTKASDVQINVAPQLDRSGHGFLLQYKKAGCPDLKPPAHAWYKRDGGQAVIGCEWSQKTWHLSCDGHSWSGVVGNCSEPVTQTMAEQEAEIELPSALLLTCVVSVAVVLAAVVLVCGVVCIKKFRIKHEIEKATTMPRQYGHYDMDPNIEMASMMYLPYKPCEHEGILVDVTPQKVPDQIDTGPLMQIIPAPMSPVHIWEQPLPDVPARKSRPESAVTATRKGRTPGDGDEGVSEVQENDTIKSGQSGFSSLNGHSYSALNSCS